MNPYLNLHSLLPASNLAGKEARGWGGAGRSRRPAEGPLPHPPAPGGGGGGGGSSKAFQLKSRLLSPLSSARLPPEPGLPDSYGFEYPSVSIRGHPGGSPSKGPVSREHVILQSDIFLILTVLGWAECTGDRREHARRGPCAQVSCLSVSAHHQTLLPVSLSLPRGLWPHVCFFSASSLPVLLTAPLCRPHLGPWRTAPSVVLTSRPDVADWPHVLCLAHTGFFKK